MQPPSHSHIDQYDDWLTDTITDAVITHSLTFTKSYKP